MAKQPRKQDDIDKLLKFMFPELKPTVKIKKSLKDFVKKELNKMTKGKPMAKGGIVKKKNNA